MDREKKDIAFIAYYFPPISGGGTSRSTKFVKYLDKYCFRPTVFTLNPEKGSFSREFQHDDLLEADLASMDYHVLRIDDPQPKAWLDLLQRWHLFPIYRMLFYRKWWELNRYWAMAVAREIIDTHAGRPFTLIYASAAPNSSLEAAALVSKRLGIPWVADLRDLWTRDSLKFYPSRFHYWWESRLEKRLLRSASNIIANTPLSGLRLREWLGQTAARKVVVIPNGYDPQEFSGVHPTKRRDTKGKTITIVHTGTLYESGIQKSRLGRYRPYALDYDARSVLPILQGLATLKKKSPAVAERIRIRLIGYAPENTRNQISAYGLDGQIALEGVVPRKDALQSIAEADATLILQVAFADKDRPVPYVPGKVYDYLASGKPILALVPAGDLAELMTKTQHAYVCAYSNPDEVAERILGLVSDLDAGRDYEQASEHSKKYDRRLLAMDLGRVFSRVKKTKRTSANNKT